MAVTNVDMLWVLISATLVFLMQAGFLCLESGLTRNKNAINVASKNVADFGLAVGLFWLCGFGLMFGHSLWGWLGLSHFAVPVGPGNDPWLATFFLFQAMFCATAATIVSGAVAERMRFVAYLITAALVSVVIYPVFGHWAWGGVYNGSPGWLEQRGFVDFAGSTVVHSVGGWVALAGVLLLGARHGRFAAGQSPHVFPAGNLPVAMLGGLLLFLGWFGFNGGSVLALDATVPGILANTVLAAIAGLLVALLVGWYWRGYPEVLYALNGMLAGLVAITASAHAVSSTSALLIGSVGGLLMLLSHELLLRWRIDDAVGAIPVHLVAGIWGTLAVAWFGDPALLATGLSRWQQLHIQALGVVVCALWSFGIAWIVLSLINRWLPLRVNPEGEEQGLNVYEHGAHNELTELLEAMERQQHSQDFSHRVPEEPFTEVGQIAQRYNQVMTTLERVVNRTQLLVRNLRDGMLTYNRQGLLTGFNPGAEAIFDRSAAMMLGQPISQLFVAEGGKLHGQLLAVGQRLELRVQRPDVTAAAQAPPRFVELLVSEGVTDGDTELSALVRDVTERKRIQEQLHWERDRALVTLASIGDGVITTDAAGQVEYLNPVAERLTGWDNQHAKGLGVSQVYRLLGEEDEQPLDNPVRLALQQAKATIRNEGRLLLSRSGKRLPVTDTAAPIRSRDGYIIGAVLVFHDITVTRDLSRELSHQAAHDALTGLSNRRDFEAKIEQLLYQQDTNEHVLCYLDLDQFKVVNDTCGHAAGDELLRQLARLLRQQVRGSDLLARLGGDEFGILFRNCTIQDAIRISETLRKTIQDFRFSWDNRLFAVGVSIGLVPISAEERRLDKLLSAADAACYAAKEHGRNRVHVYQPDDRHLLERQGQMEWVGRLRSALDEDRLRLYVQPIVPLDDQAGLKYHYEILLRLEEQERLVGPGSFIPAAERYGLMDQVDCWVVDNVVAWLSDNRHRSECQNQHYLINLSGMSLSSDRFRDYLLERIRQAELPPGLLGFELTESAAVANLSLAIEFVNAVRQLGCRFALDDFGSGLSSFAYLKNLPVDYLKIDGGFIRDIGQESVNLALVEAIHTIGHVMGLQTVAECVEDETTLAHLKAIGIDYGQGFYLGKPQPLTVFAQDHVRLMPR